MLLHCSTGHDADESDFTRDLGSARGYKYRCKKCEAAQRKLQRAALVAKRTLPAPLAGQADVPFAPSPETPPPPPTSKLVEAMRENERLKRELAAVKGFEAPPTIHIPRAEVDHGDSIACAVASDWHVEESVEAEKVHGLNEFNLDIAKERSTRFFQNTLRLTDIFARESNITTLWLGLLGDFFSGHIHEELQETNFLAPGPAAQFALGLLSSGIEFLLHESEYNLEIDCVPGNHGRMTKKPRIQNATETSLETFMYHALAARFEGNPRVKFRVAASKMLYRRFFERFNMRLIHGDDVKFGGGVGGVTIPIRKKLAAWDKAVRADLTVMGHFHQLLDGGDFIVNGSLIGYNEFAQAIGASPEEARQAFFLVHARKGGQKSIVAPVWLDNPKEKP